MNTKRILRDTPTYQNPCISKPQLRDHQALLLSKARKELTFIRENFNSPSENELNLQLSWKIKLTRIPHPLDIFWGFTEIHWVFLVKTVLSNSDVKNASCGENWFWYNQFPWDAYFRPWPKRWMPQAYNSSLSQPAPPGPLPTKSHQSLSKPISSRLPWHLPPKPSAPILPPVAATNCLFKHLTALTSGFKNAGNIFCSLFYPKSLD